ncbi:hypothetical protein K239x_00230 [Planctomycetes bacterium K23_9]|uniref:DUF3299 domain-containing protein n=2 Tax=Stieleria marina TaxID=1930275 RepID=A0A517NLT1_9BACT|nr:hypothetical protein K239x_00230 [Planctomycetes bacterium K23_9]
MLVRPGSNASSPSSQPVPSATALSDAAQLEVAEPNVAQSDVAQSDVAQSDVAQSDVAQSSGDLESDLAPSDSQSANQTRQAVQTDQSTDAAIDPRTKGVVIKKSSAAARAKGEITFDDLQFKIKKDAKFTDEMLDDDVKSLDGINVRLTGFILPTTLFKETGIDQFVLVRDNQECCFGPGAALFDCVIVEMQGDNTTDFVTRPVTVHGKLKIDTKKYKYPGGKGPRGTTHFAIFRIEGQKVE